MIRVELPYHLRNLAGVAGEVTLELDGEPTIAAVLDALDSRFIWTTEYAGSRLRWRSRDPLWVLALRVHVLDEPITVPFRDAYGGCTSWVDLDGLPADPASVGSQPAVSDAAYESRVAAIADAIPGGLEPPVV